MRKTWLKRASVMCMAALLAATGVLASGCSAKKQDEQVVIYSSDVWNLRTGRKADRRGQKYRGRYGDDEHLLY